MTYLVDSDWIADYLDGRPPAIALVNRLAPDGLAISIITYAEIYEGIYYGRDPVRAEQVLQGLLQGVRVLPISRPVARRYARIRGSLRRLGRLIAQPDLLIAATAIHHDLTLATRNLRHYERIPGLKLLIPDP